MWNERAQALNASILMRQEAARDQSYERPAVDAEALLDVDS